MAGRTILGGTVYHKTIPRSKSRNVLGQGQFSVFLPRRDDAEYYVRSPVKVKAEMLLSPEHLGGRCLGSIPCRARAEKLTRENGMSVVNVPIKIEAELLLTPGMSFSCKPATPQSPTPQDIHEGSLQASPPSQVGDSWELWGKKMKAALRKYRSQYGVKSENLWQTKQVLVSELRLDNNSAKIRELTKRISSYGVQVFEQNKRIRLLQARLREEGGRVESSEKVNAVEQQCRLLEKRLKVAESRAMGAEHQAEAIKLRTRDLGVVCGHQGVQLKELAKQIDIFAKILRSQRITAMDTYKAWEQQVGMQTVFETKPLSSGVSTLMRTSNNNLLQIQSPPVKLYPQPLCRKFNIPEQENQGLSLPCASYSTGCRGFRDQVLTPMSEPRPNSECSKSEDVSQNHLGCILDKLMHFAPNLDMEFNSSRKGAEELIQQCAVQASKLKDLSTELDCLGTKTGRERKSSPRILFSESQVCEMRSDSIESSPFSEELSGKPSIQLKATQGSVELEVATDSMQISVEDVTYEVALVSERPESSVDKPIMHKFTVIGKAKPKLESPSKKRLIDRSTQTLTTSTSLSPTVELLPTDEKGRELTRRCTHLLVASPSSARNSWQAAFSRASLPLRYEIQMWRLGSQTLIQASLLWFGFRLLPQMHFICYIPPPT